MKKIISIMFFTCLIIALYHRHDQHRPDHDTIVDHHNWQTFEKKPDQIVSRKTNKQEIIEAKLPIDQQVSKQARGPASLAPQREFILPHGQTKPPGLTIINTPHPEWQQRMAPQLMRFLKEGTKLFVKKEKSVTILERDVGRHAEQVYIRFQTEQGRHYGYHALVDSQTGMVLKTWNRTLHEGFGHERVRLRVPNLK